jgi:hypothetical protein
VRFIFPLLLVLSGCNPTVQCWYGVSRHTVGSPYFGLRGHTIGILSFDLDGPMFQAQEQMESYIKTQNLQMCGQVSK